VNTWQHESHQDLLAHFDSARIPCAPLDAIIVPNGRPAAYLNHAINAAKLLDAHLVLLCSMRAGASSAALVAKREGVRVTAVDVDFLPDRVVPDFATDKLLRLSRFHRPVDTSLKRNLGLLLASFAGWKRILFLDDDIKLPNPGDLTAAAGLLDDHSVVGLANAGMPDNSVVCHALRDVGDDQDVFIGGGALVVGEAAFSSFFPNIYNEDWFFLLDGLKLRPSAVTGTAWQYNYDPYNDPRRARGEELGDTLAEGVFGLLDNGSGLADADNAYWSDFLPERRRIISTTIERVRSSDLEPGQQARMVAALKASIGRSYLITPELCVQYLQAWQADCLRWQRHIRAFQRDRRGGTGIDGALATLKIAHLAQPGIDGRISPDLKRRSPWVRSAVPA
jgi:hypothetical protein